MIEPDLILADIAHALAVQDAGRPGLLDGTCGRALFYAYYHRATGAAAHADTARTIISGVLDMIAREPVAISHCSGLGGIAWCIQHLADLGVLELDAEVFAEIDEAVGAAVLACERHDVLHDALGAALYLAERAAAGAPRAGLVAVLDILERTAIRDATGIRWATDGRCNLGLAHGIPGILGIVARIHECGIAPERTARMLRDTARWLLATRRAPSTGCGSVFPIEADLAGEPLGEPRSRLGWCYGDLGVAASVLHAAVALADTALADAARDILHHTLAARTADNGQIADAALCHGSLGVSHIYRRAYLATGDAALRAGAERWLAHGLALPRWPDGAAGFKCRTRDGFATSYDLLQGIAGIGLALIAAAGDAQASAWDRCLLLS